AYKGVEPVNNVLAAVNRLGASTTQSLAFSLAVSELFQSDSPLVEARLKQLYAYSVELGALCFSIADRCPELDREQALLLGLICHIGAIPLLAYTGDKDKFSESHNGIDDLLKNLGCITTELVLTQWGFDPQASHVCDNCKAPNIVNVNKPITYTDVLQIAGLWLQTDFLGNKQSVLDDTDHPLQQKLKMNGIAASREEFIQTMAEELEATRQLLAG
ncbi:MAG: HDOD domain-containing protein, partial [Pseudomonadota bacterium]